MSQIPSMSDLKDENVRVCRINYTRLDIVASTHPCLMFMKCFELVYRDRTRSSPVFVTYLWCYYSGFVKYPQASCRWDCLGYVVSILVETASHCSQPLGEETFKRDRLWRDMTQNWHGRASRPMTSKTKKEGSRKTLPIHEMCKP